MGNTRFVPPDGVHTRGGIRVPPLAPFGLGVNVDGGS